MHVSRYFVLEGVLLLALVSFVLGQRQDPAYYWALALLGPLALIGIYDVLQTGHSILRNYPIIGHIRFLLEAIRPEIRQYLVESDREPVPFSREQRSLVYQRAKNVIDKQPFGTVLDVNAPGYGWISHSIRAIDLPTTDFRIIIGGSACAQPYSASILNVSGMSYGAISPNAIRALNKGAKVGGFAQNTGEGSISRYHRQYGGDIIWQVASGYFGCRTKDGRFDPDAFARVAKGPQVKMIEVKLSQGAKPGHGGVLPRAKISPEIARTRGVSREHDCVSPPAHSAFTTPLEFVVFLEKLRDLSGGKPVGMKLCVGHRYEFLAIVKAMLEKNITPDFIVVDGKEGGTGAAPRELTNHVGLPLLDGLIFVRDALIGAGLRDRIKIGASGKLISAYDICRTLALGADYVMCARGFMFALGCIQARACHTNHCPTGVTTQNWLRQRALVVSDKAQRVVNYHKNTLRAVRDVIGAAGLSHPEDLKPRHLHLRQQSGEVMHGAEAYPAPRPGSLIDGTAEGFLAREWKRAQAGSFQPITEY